MVESDSVKKYEEMLANEDFQKAQAERYENYIQYLLKNNGFKNRHQAEKWVEKESKKRLAKFIKKVKRDTGKEKPLFVATEEDMIGTENE